MEPPLREETRIRLAVAVQKVGGVGTAADLLGIQPASLDLILNGKRGLGFPLAFRIQRQFEIDMDDWWDTRDFPRYDVKIKRAG